MSEDRGLKLCIFLTDPLEVLYAKGEIKERYYNPGDLFAEIHMISFCDRDIDPGKVVIVVGRARLFIHSIGRRSVLSVINLTFGGFGRIVSLVKDIRPDCIRAYDISLSGALACYCAKKLGIPCVLSIHGNFTDQRRYDRRPILHVRRILEQYSLSACDRLICISEQLKEYANNRGRGDAEVIYEGINISQFSQGTVQRSRSGPVTLLTVGRLARPKNPECVIRAVKDLDVKLVLIGDGEYRDRLKKLCSDLRILQKVEFISSVPNNMIHTYYRQADIFVLSTLYEGLCIPVIEAMASGLPVVASDIPVIREVMGDCGVLCANSPDAFRVNIARLIGDPGLCADLGGRALNRSKLFDFVISEKKESGLYQSLIRGRE